MNINHQRQLEQLARIAPDLHATTIARWPIISHRVVTGAMQQALVRLTQPTVAGLIYQVIRLIESQPSIPTRGTIMIRESKDFKAELYRTRQDDLRLRVNGSTAHVGFWGRDDDIISSAQAGKWKVSPAAQRNIERLLK